MKSNKPPASRDLSKNKSSVFDFLQKLGKVLMVVIAVMPAAGIMISLGKLIAMIGTDIAFINTCKQKNNKLHLLKNSDITNYFFDENYQYINFKNLKSYEKKSIPKQSGIGKHLAVLFIHGT